MASSTILFIAAIINVCLGLAVVLRGFRSPHNRYFFFFTAFVSIWTFTNALFITANGSARFFMALLSYAAAIMLATMFLLFCISLQSGKLRTFKNLRLQILLIGITGAAVSVIPGMIAYDVTDDLKITTNAVGLGVYGIGLAILFASSIFILVRITRSQASRKTKQAATAILSGFVVAIIIGVSFNLVLPIFHNYEFVSLGPLGSLFLVVACAYSIVKHRLFDIRKVVVRTVAYILSLLSLAALYYSSVYLISVTILAENQIVSLQPIHIILAIILAFIFQPIRQFFDRLTASIFYRDHYSSNRFIRELGAVLTSTSELAPLLDRTATLFMRAFKSDFVYIVARGDNNKIVRRGVGSYVPPAKQDLEVLFESVKEQGIIVSDSLPAKDKSLWRMLTGYKVAVVQPIVHDGVVRGMVCFGSARGRDYSHRDTMLMTTSTDELLIAIQNALSVQEISDLNENLQQRIAVATAELRTSNEQLRQLDEAKDEFVSMASHQLRTPLTSVKGYVSMMLDGDAGKISADQKKLLKEAFLSSERMVHLINDFLNVSRIQTGKFTIDTQKTDLVKIIRQEIDMLKSSADSREIKIKASLPRKKIIMDIDESKMRQVIMNFIDNALYYSPAKTTIRVELKEVGRSVELRVIDNGIGVPAAQQHKLFGKFFRADNARTHRPDGTGVGIYLAKRVIDGHGGKIIFSSEEGKGSTFGFKLSLDPATK